jgi:hypothetical protein
MSVTESRNAAKRAYRQAMEIIDREWLASGVTQEELAQDARLAEIFDRLVGSGRTVDDIRAEWEAKTVEEILREYALPVPERQSA